MYVFSDESIDSYGDRIIIEGLEIDRYEKNPILLYRHGSYEFPVGSVKKIRKEDGRLVADEIEWDEDDAFAKIVKSKYEKGFMSAFSIGFSGIEDDYRLNVAGQKGTTFTRAELFEISCVIMPSNKNAVQLRELEVAFEKEAINFTKSNKKNNMNLLIKQLGLGAQSTESELVSEIVNLQNSIKAKETELVKKEAELVKLEDELAKLSETQKEDRATSLIEKAISENKITNAQVPHYTALAKIDFLNTKAALDSMDGYTSITSQIREAKTGFKKDDRKEWRFTKWQKEDPAGLAELRDTDPEFYKELLKTLNK